MLKLEIQEESQYNRARKYSIHKVIQFQTPLRKVIQEFSTSSSKICSSSERRGKHTTFRNNQQSVDVLVNIDSAVESLLHIVQKKIQNGISCMVYKKHLGQDKKCLVINQIKDSEWPNIPGKKEGGKGHIWQDPCVHDYNL